jgi:hypothetical protein
VRAADYHESPAAPELLDDFDHLLLVDDVAGHADDVGLEVKIDLPHILVTQRHLVFRRSQTRERRHRQIREDALLAERREDPVVGPEGRRILRCDEMDIHGRLR